MQCWITQLDSEFMKITAFFCQSGRKKELVPLEWDYLQELRVFNSKGEIRLNKRNEKWVGRYRGEKSGLEDGERIEEEYFIDEYQNFGEALKMLRT